MYEGVLFPYFWREKKISHVLQQKDCVMNRNFMHGFVYIYKFFHLRVIFVSFFSCPPAYPLLLSVLNERVWLRNDTNVRRWMWQVCRMKFHLKELLTNRAHHTAASFSAVRFVLFLFFFSLLFHSCYLFLFHSINTHLAMPRNSNLNSNTTTSMFFFVLFFVFFLEKDPANRVRECLSMLSVTL